MTLGAVSPTTATIVLLINDSHVFQCLKAFSKGHAFKEIIIEIDKKEIFFLFFE